MTALRRRMMEDLQIHNYAPSTVRAYIRGVADFAKHFGKSPDQLGAEQIREYQLLIKEKGVALPTYIQIVSGLRFLYANTLQRQVGVEHIPFPRCRWQLDQDDDLGSHRVHSPLSPPRSPLRLCAHPVFRLPGQPQTEAKAGAVPLFAVCPASCQRSQAGFSEQP